MKSKSNNKSSYFVILILCIVVIGLSIAFAALSSQLNINFGAVSQGEQTWNVEFEQNNSISAVNFGTSSTGRTCGIASAGAIKVEVGNTTLSKPGDGCRSPLKIVNSGTRDAVLGSITFNLSNGMNNCQINSEHKAIMQCGNVTYKITTDASGNNPLTYSGYPTNDVLGNSINSGTNLNVYLFALYTGNGLVDSDTVHTNMSIDLNFVQK